MVSAQQPGGIPGTREFLIWWFFWQWCLNAVTASAPAVKLNCSWWLLVFTMMLFIWVPPVNSLGLGWTESLWGAGRNFSFSMRPLTLPFLHVISGLAVYVWRWMPVKSGSAFPLSCSLLSMHGFPGNLVKKIFGWLEVNWIAPLDFKL